MARLSPKLDVDGMLREPLAPEAVRNLNLGNFDGRNLDAGHLDGGRDGGRGDRHANDKHNGQNQCKKFSHNISSFYFAGLNADSYKYIDGCQRQKPTFYRVYPAPFKFPRCK